MKEIFNIIAALLFGSLGVLGLNWLMGQGKGRIIIEFDDRYTDFDKYIKAILKELTRQGHMASYPGYRKFLIDGKKYDFMERNVSIEGFLYSGPFSFQKGNLC
ncbi:hypothetical protein SAMN05443252_10317 [Bacillus sp. OV322]|uniref:hypothetical protein n=1 Tax=Bacillus sp. OV322 TaxID=1882764 RepID=UPI0008E91B27|nr:hypothetical protein [Bacillus sp. OV322]SFC35437.1 hypothetical protein SAMN05443252_10317 [Bacillus sp. OV322]